MNSYRFVSLPLEFDTQKVFRWKIVNNYFEAINNKTLVKDLSVVAPNAQILYTSQFFVYANVGIDVVIYGKFGGIFTRIFQIQEVGPFNLNSSEIWGPPLVLSASFIQVGGNFSNPMTGPNLIKYVESLIPKITLAELIQSDIRSFCYKLRKPSILLTVQNGSEIVTPSFYSDFDQLERNKAVEGLLRISGFASLLIDKADISILELPPQLLYVGPELAVSKPVLYVLEKV